MKLFFPVWWNISSIRDKFHRKIIFLIVLKKKSFHPPFVCVPDDILAFEELQTPICPGICQSICLYICFSTGVSVRLWKIHVSVIKPQRMETRAGCRLKGEAFRIGDNALCLMIGWSYSSATAELKNAAKMLISFRLCIEPKQNLRVGNIFNLFALCFWTLVLNKNKDFITLPSKMGNNVNAGVRLTVTKNIHLKNRF